jgi:sugar phosphate isomerase/epimerase
MPELGLKLWSTNVDFIPIARQLHDNGVYRYIELYTVPDTFRANIGKWKEVEIPFAIHAPHSGHGMNLAQAERSATNGVLIGESRRFADTLKAERIIIHPGVGGDIHETARQMAACKEGRFVIENKPYFSIYDHSVCNGYSPQDIRFVMEETGVGFCLDFGHAICAANALKLDRIEWVSTFARMKPVMYHVSDGDYEGVADKHLSLGRGDYRLDELMRFVPVDAMVTLETEKDENLRLFQEDVRILSGHLGAA